MPTVFQTVLGAGQFDGTAGAGLFDFVRFNEIPRTTRVSICTISYAAAGEGNPGDRVDIYAFRPGGLPTERILLGRALAAQILGPDGDGDYTICGRLLPRDLPGLGSVNGQQWEIRVFSFGKTVTATVCLDFVLQPFPDDL